MHKHMQSVQKVRKSVKHRPPPSKVRQTAKVHQQREGLPSNSDIMSGPTEAPQAQNIEDVADILVVHPGPKLCDHDAIGLVAYKADAASQHVVA